MMRATVVVALVFLAVLACGSPTQPTAIQNTAPAATQAAATPLSDISGAWTGKIAYEYPDDWCTCCIPDYQASATFAQNGSDVTGSIKSICLDERFTGRLQNGQVTGTVQITSGNTTYDGIASGQATTAMFLFASKQLQANGQAISGFNIAFSR